MKEIATKEEMKLEAISRMKSIGLDQQYIDDFSQEEYYAITAFWGALAGESPDLIGDLEKTVINEFETATNSLVWAVINDYIFVDIHSVVINLLYVSNDKSKWKEEREALVNMNPHAYYKIFILDGYDQTGSGYADLNIKVENGDLTMY